MMNFSARLRRSLREALCLPSRPRGPRPDAEVPFRETRVQELRDPDWAIREIVDEALFEPAR